MGNCIQNSVQISRERNVKLQPTSLVDFDETRIPVRNLDQLPVEIIMEIFEYLSFEDILKLRQVSKVLYDASKSSTFFDKIKFKVTKLSKENFVKLEYMLKLGQSRITLDIRDLPLRKIKHFMPYFSNVSDISIALKHLEDVCRHCDNLYRLTVKLNVSANQNYKDAFSCILNMHNINELILEDKCDRLEKRKLNYQKALALKMLSISALKNSKGVVTKIKFRSVCLAFNHHEWDSELRQVFTNANHIKSWSFTGCYDTPKMIPLPKKVIKLEVIRGSLMNFNINYIEVNTLILNETNFHRYCRQDYPNIKTLELRKLSLGYLAYMELSFPNLESLTVESPDPEIGRGLLFSDLDEFIFLECSKSSLKCLTLISIDGIDYSKLGLFLERFSLLTDLCFVNVSGIPSDFLDAWGTRVKLKVMAI